VTVRARSTSRSSGDFTVIDQALRDYETVWAAAGTPHTVMPLTFEDLVTLTSGTVRQVSTDIGGD
jgi:prolyl-tRNA editing enzyme YbaK/EbsC (Cys-tRNA(Pro) deacylase)